MAWTSMQSTIFSKQLSAYIQKNIVLKNAVNFNWENEAKRNKIVTINHLTAPTVYTLTAGQGIISGSDVAYTYLNLTMDQYKYNNIIVEDILKATSDVFSFDPIASAMAYELAQVQDAAIAAEWANTSTTNWIQSGSSFAVNNSYTETATSGSAYDAAVNLAIKLDEAHAPKQDRFLIAPSWFVNMMAKDTRFASFSPEVKANGIMGSVAGLTVLQSENVVNSNNIYNIMAVQKQAITFASGLETLEMLRSELQFADKLRALAVYGIKTVTPEYGAVLFARKV